MRSIRAAEPGRPRRADETAASPRASVPEHEALVERRVAGADDPREAGVVHLEAAAPAHAGVRAGWVGAVGIRGGQKERVGLQLGEGQDRAAATHAQGGRVEAANGPPLGGARVTVWLPLEAQSAGITPEPAVKA